MIISRNQTWGEETLRVKNATGSEGSIMVLDVTNEGNFAKLIDTMVAKYGKFDTIVNNADISGEQAGFLADSSAENFKSVLDTNVMGLFYGMKYTIKAMLKMGGRSIVILASIAVLMEFFILLNTVNQSMRL